MTVLRTTQTVPKEAGFAPIIIGVFLLIAALLAIPILDLPLLGLSLTAPLMFLVAMEAIFRPTRPWSLIGRRYILLAVLIWVGTFLSMIVNGLSSGGTAINTEGILTVIRYAYWLFVFVLTAYMVAAGRLGKAVSRVFGWSILVLVLLRWGETLLYGNVGAWTDTRLMTQNSYGFLFSVFSPFLLALIFSESKWERWMAVAGTVLLWGAAGINGSRGSWVGVTVSLLAFLGILGLSRPKKGLMGALLLVLMAGAAFWAFSSSDRIFEAIEQRSTSLQKLEDDKSYMIRQLMNQKALRLFEQSPYFGVGPGRFRFSSVPLDIPYVLSYASQSHFDVKSSHNSYLGFLAENGLVGGVPFALLLVHLAVTGFKSALSLGRNKEFWGAGVYAAFIGMSVHMWAISSLTNTANWFIYGLVAGMIVLARADPGELKSAPRFSLPRPRRFQT